MPSKAIRLLTKINKLVGKRKAVQSELEFESPRTGQVVARIVLSEDDEVALLMMPTTKDGHTLLSAESFEGLAEWFQEQTGE